MSALSNTTAPSSKVLAFLQLLRLPNVFTAMADVVMGYVFVHPAAAGPLGALLLLLAASSALYLAGMVLNDVYDIEQDRRQRPFRPLPSGAIPLRQAFLLGYGLLATGVLLGAVAGPAAGQAAALPWRSGLIALLLAVCVVLYDAVLKAGPLGPLVMGACRLLNVLLGMSLAERTAAAAVWTAGYFPAELAVAAAIGIYVAGVTLFARREATESHPGQLLAAVVVMVAGLVLLGCYPQLDGGAQRMRLAAPFVWPCLLLLLGFTVVRRCLTAVTDPRPRRVQMAVRQCILSLIILDASVCLAVKPDEPYWAVGVILLLVPTLMLGRWVYST